MNIAINPLITTKDVRDQLWNCRDFELSHLWQRSIFLTTLLVLCLTAYGVVVMELVDKVSTSPGSRQCICLEQYCYDNLLNGICIFLFMGYDEQGFQSMV